MELLKERREGGGVWGVEMCVLLFEWRGCIWDSLGMRIWMDRCNVYIYLGGDGERQGSRYAVLHRVINGTIEWIWMCGWM